jgi:hypothetical protein
MATFPGSYVRSNLVLSRKQVQQIDEELRLRWKLFCPHSNDPRASAVFAKITDAVYGYGRNFAQVEAGLVKKPCRLNFRLLCPPTYQKVQCFPRVNPAVNNPTKFNL